MADTFAQVADVVTAVQDYWPHTPRVALILGSGLGGLSEAIADAVDVDYANLPHLPQSTAMGHRGRFVCGQLAGIDVIAMQGRFHAYEGYAIDRVSFPVRIMHGMGADMLIVSNAAGGLNPQYRVGDVMVIDDHINLMFRNPLVGANDTRLGPRWPDMSEPYDRTLGDMACAVARSSGFVCHRGVYMGSLGPTYETRAEYRMTRRLGGDVVGMSTVPEVIVAVQLGMRVLGLSAVTNACSPDQLDETSGEHVITAATAASEKLRTIVEGVIVSLT